MGGLIGLVLFGLASLTAQASEGCEFQNSLQDLAWIHNNPPSNDYSENLRAELVVRKKIFNQLIDCGIAEATGLQSSIQSVSVDSPEMKDSQNRLSSKFGDAINYYRLQKTLVGDLGIEGSKQFSKDIKEWRSSNYAPLAELGKNFVIFRKNQDLMETAHKRLNQIEQTLRILKVTDNETVRIILQNAQDNFGKAKSDNDRAQQIFRQLSWPNDSSQLAESSLAYLKETYQNFFDIRNELGKIISGAH